VTCRDISVHPRRYGKSEFVPPNAIHQLQSLVVLIKIVAELLRKSREYKQLYLFIFRIRKTNSIMLSIIQKKSILAYSITGETFSKFLGAKIRKKWQ
jgi:hypothetical protein